MLLGAVSRGHSKARAPGQTHLQLANPQPAALSMTGQTGSLVNRATQLRTFRRGLCWKNTRSAVTTATWGSQERPDFTPQHDPKPLLGQPQGLTQQGLWAQ